MWPANQVRFVAQLDGVPDHEYGGQKCDVPGRGDAFTQTESTTETARRILAKHGLSFQPERKPVPHKAYHELDHDLTADERNHKTDNR